MIAMGDHLWPSGQHLTIGLWWDRPVPAPLLVVGDFLVEQGARYAGALFAGPPDAPFDWVTSVEGLGYLEGLPADDVRRHERDGTAYRVALELPGLGPGWVSFEGTPGRTVPPARHVVDVTFEADVLGIPAEYREDEDQAEAGVRESAVVNLLAACCAGLDPAYATVHSEARTLTPEEMAAGRPWESHEIYLADRVAAHLDLREIARHSLRYDWPGGTYFSSEGAAADRPSLRPAWAGVARVIGGMYG